MFTRTRLVLALSQRGDEHQHASFLERAQAERGGDEARGRVALGAYLAARLVERLLRSSENAEDEEAIRWQYQTTREYLTDRPRMPAPTLAHLHALDSPVLDALLQRQHPTHFTIDLADELARQVGARRTLFTHIAHELGHEETCASLPESMALAYDGLSIQVA